MAIISNGTTIADAGAFSANLGSMVHIKTITASNDANVDFNHGTSGVVLDSTYPIYIIKFINVHPATNDTQFFFQANGAGETGFNETITSTYFKAGHSEAGNYAVLSYTAGSDQAQGTAYQSISENMGNENDECGSGELILFNPSSTTYAKHFIVKHSHQQHASQSYQTHVSGYFNTTTAIDQIVFAFGSGNIDSGTFKLYGLKDS